MKIPADLFRDLWFSMNDLYPRKLWAATVHYMYANRQVHTSLPSKVTQVTVSLKLRLNIFSNFRAVPSYSANNRRLLLFCV
jgi:hypothetical protein